MSPEAASFSGRFYDFEYVVCIIWRFESRDNIMGGSFYNLSSEILFVGDLNLENAPCKLDNYPTLMLRACDKL